MKTEQEIEERIEILEEHKLKFEDPNYWGAYHIKDWNRAQIDTALWYLKWVLGRE